MIKEIQHNGTKITLVGIAHNSSISKTVIKNICEKYHNSPILLEMNQITYESIFLEKRFDSIYHFLEHTNKQNIKPETYVIENHYKRTHFIDVNYKTTLKLYLEEAPLLNKVVILLNTLKNAIMQPIYPDCTPPANINQIYEINKNVSKPYKKIIIEYRDKFMLNKIKNFIERHKPKHVIIIVGAGHLPYLLNNL
jgi:pheromone shutdown protein TraB